MNRAIASAEDVRAATAQICVVGDLCRLTSRYSVRVSFKGGAVSCEWQPEVPSERALQAFMPKYRQARDDVLSEVARLLKGRVLVVEAFPSQRGTE